MTEAEAFAAIALAAVAADGKIRQDEASALRKVLEHPWFSDNGAILTMPKRGKTGGGVLGLRRMPSVLTLERRPSAVSLEHTIDGVRNTDAAHGWGREVLDFLRRHLTQHEKCKLVRRFQEGACAMSE